MLPQLTDTRQRLTQSIDKLPQPLVVGMVGVAGYFLLLAFYVANALAFGVVEILWNLEEPAYLYGQEWAMFACVSGLLGAATGVSIALLRHRQWLISALALMAGCGLTSFAVTKSRNWHVAEHGHDLVEYMTYWPFLFVIPAVVLLWLLCFGDYVRLSLKTQP